MIYGDVVSNQQEMITGYSHLLLPHYWNTLNETPKCESVLNTKFNSV